MSLSGVRPMLLTCWPDEPSIATWPMTVLCLRLAAPTPPPLGDGARADARPPRRRDGRVLRDGARAGAGVQRLRQLQHQRDRHRDRARGRRRRADRAGARWLGAMRSLPSQVPLVD